MDKIAVDNATKKYWDTYFKEYGKMWTREIPRRVKTAMIRTKDLGVKTAEGNIVPIAHHIAEDDTLFIEAAFSGKLDDRDAKVLVLASFNKEGKMLSFEANRVV